MKISVEEKYQFCHRSTMVPDVSTSSIEKERGKPLQTLGILRRLLSWARQEDDVIDMAV